MGKKGDIQLSYKTDKKCNLEFITPPDGFVTWAGSKQSRVIPGIG